MMVPPDLLVPDQAQVVALFEPTAHPRGRRQGEPVINARLVVGVAEAGQPVSVEDVLDLGSSSP